MRVAIHTLGCKVNQCDADALIAALNARGYNAFSTRNFDVNADVFVVNTCTVTHTSDKKSLQMLRRARKNNPGALIALCGCMAKNQIEFRGADIVFDARNPSRFFAELEAVKKSASIHDMPENEIRSTSAEMESKTRATFPNGVHPSQGGGGNKTRAFVKIQDGCDRFCSYCIVPHVRGAPVSRPIAEIVAEVETLVASGAMEVVLTGIQVAAYGDDKAGLPRLLRAVSDVANLRRLRLSSLDPTAVDENFLAALTPKLCGHFHLSLQSGCDTTLKKMNRRYTAAEYKKAALALRQICPEAALTTDIIVGFPGESDADFAASVNFVQEMEFARLHVFEFSPRKGTPAADFPDQIPPQIKKQRGKIMRETAAKLQGKFLQKQIGKTLSVLFETATEGHAENYCRVKAKNAKTNTIQQVKILSSTEDVLDGAVVDDETF